MRRFPTALLAVACLPALADNAQLNREQMEEFLRTAKIINTRAASKGITGSLRVTLSNGTLTHDAHVQSIDVYKPEFRSDRGVEMNFKDSYKFNIAAYRLDRILGLNMTPVSVERKVAGKTSAITWWVDDVLMDEQARLAKKLPAPDPELWNERMHIVRVFDQLICNMDRNLGNLLISRDWDLHMIDHTRAFRIVKNVPAARNLEKCERGLLQHLKELNEETVTRELRPYLTKTEVLALLARRDDIVAHFQRLIGERGETAVLYDLRPLKAATASPTQ